MRSPPATLISKVCNFKLTRYQQSVFDVFTDGWSGYTFIFGNDYIKNVASPNDTSVTAYPCKSISRYIIVAENGTESVEYYWYQCFETNPQWGVAACSFQDCGEVQFWLDKVPA